MRIFLVFLLIAAASANVDVNKALESGLHPFSVEMVNMINSAGLTWKAKQHFTEKDLENVKTRLGAILDHPLKAPTINESSHFDMSAAIPGEFDPRVTWPKCAEIIGDIRDQSNCGSCWAFAAVGVMSDRICIASDGAQKVEISADDLLSCCTLLNSFSFCGFGCNGGMMSLAFRYWVKRGIVSGGNYNDTNTCRPYEIEPCGHHDDKSKNPCKGNSRTPRCQRKCVNGADYRKDKHYGSKYYGLRGAEAIQRDIMQHGSVEAGFTVYSDFPQYHDSVYQRTSNSAHAVRIIGWGVEKTNASSIPYWLVANSWNSDWGNKGYFKILRGENHCGIENQVATGLPQL